MLQEAKSCINEYIWDCFPAVIPHQGKYLEIRLSLCSGTTKRPAVLMLFHHLMIFLILCGGFTALLCMPPRSPLVTIYVGCVPISKSVLWHSWLAANKAIQYFNINIKIHFIIEI